MISVQDLLSKHGDVIIHAYDPADYNPQAAHDYYLRTRHLKGRRHGLAKAPLVGRNPRHTQVLLAKHGKKPLPKKSAEQHRKEVEARVKVLTTKLEHLRVILAGLVREARKRSGVKTKAPSATPTSAAAAKATKTGPSKKQTPQEKHKAALASKKYRAEHPISPDQHAKQLQAQIDTITTRIKEVKAQIAAAKAQAHGAPSPATAKPIHTTPDKAGRKPGDPHYGEDPPAKAKPRTSSSVGARANTNK